MEIESQAKNEKNPFENPQITAVVQKNFEDMCSIAANSIPKLFSDLCQETRFLVGFQARLNFFRYGTFNLSRSIYYIF